jgi:hypothetical protein
VSSDGRVRVLVVRAWTDDDGRLISRVLALSEDGEERALGTSVGVEAAVDLVRRWLSGVTPL